ncbi:MAG: BatA domain-containing protein, partial [Pseudomonadota bacterium]
MIGAIAFTTPLLLAALFALPILWWLLRAVPPAPIKRRFPGIALLLGLKDDESQTDTTPWWLLLLRMLAVAGLIVGFAGPILNPDERQPGNAPLLIVMDGSWASARDWPARLNRAEAILSEAARDGRPTGLVSLSDLRADAAQFTAADALLPTLSGMVPNAWAPAGDSAEVLRDMTDGQSFDTVWFSDGLRYPARAELADFLQSKGDLRVIQSVRPVFALRPARFEGSDIAITALRSPADAPRDATLIAYGPDPNGVEQELARATASFGAGAEEAEVVLSLPTELRNRIRRFELQSSRSAGAVSLTDDALKRREVGLLASAEGQEAQDLLSPLYYLRRALAPSADLIDGDLEEMLIASPDVLVLADIAALGEYETELLTDWVDAGGMLVRFAGPRTASADFDAGDPLMPVRLRAGGRSVGGAMSWGEPKTLRDFTRDSPFFGLPLPDDVSVTSQVMAQPDPNLAERTIATLADGTPLVTRRSFGQGQIVLFHVTANAEWSTLPLSGLFVQMLERLAISTRPVELSAEQLAGTTWMPEEVLDGFGQARRADALAGVPGEVLAEGIAGQNLRPGLYRNDDRRIALNVIS